MNTTPPDAKPTATRRGAPVTALLIAAVFGLALWPWMGCSVQRDYKLLSFFFDGVPDPNAPAMLEDSDLPAGSAPRQVAFVHKPYAENKCDVCHGRASGRYEEFTKADMAVCTTCHEGVRTQFTHMHGPVAVGECNLCHVPHESSVPALLLDTAPAVCVRCHVPELLSSQPADHLTSRNCLECHVGHGSPKRGLLRDGWTLATPTTSPADGGAKP